MAKNESPQELTRRWLAVKRLARQQASGNEVDLLKEVATIAGGDGDVDAAFMIDHQPDLKERLQAGIDSRSPMGPVGGRKPPEPKKREAKPGKDRKDKGGKDRGEK